MKKCIYIALCVISMAACTDDSVHELEHDRDQLNSVGTVTTRLIVKLAKYGVTDLEGFVKQGDFLSVGRSYEDYQVRVINLRTNQCTGRLRLGERADEATGITNLSMGPDGSVTALDFQHGRLHEISSSPLARSETPALQMSTERQHLIAVKGESFVISTGLYEEGRYRFYSLESGKEEYFLSYPGHPDYPNISQRTKSILYASTVLRLRPDNGAFVCTDIRSGIMDICRVNGDKIENVCRHCYYYPKVEIIENEDVSVAYYEDNVSGFRDVAVSNDRIYVLYSGKTYRELKQNVSQCQTLLVFDWEGNQLSSLAIDTPVTHLSFDLSENVLYGLTGTYGDVAIVRLNL